MEGLGTPGQHTYEVGRSQGKAVLDVARAATRLSGTGLSGTFGGDSAVYRSRRGVERRLWQFTIILMVLFVVFSLASFLFAPTF